jgi:hypothetical protein
MTCGVPPWKRNVAQHGDALDLLTSLSDACAALAFFDPQHRAVLDKLKFGNEGARQRERCALPAMDESAGGFGVLHAALRQGREFIGCDAVAPAVERFGEFAITNFPNSAAAPPVPTS